jgi:hypothetical protein
VNEFEGTCLKDKEWITHMNSTRAHKPFVSRSLSFGLSAIYEHGVKLTMGDILFEQNIHGFALVRGGGDAEMRLVAKTSVETSRNMWCVARR